MRFYRMVKSRDLPYTILFPDSLPMADSLLNEANVDLIVTDLNFNNGAFADWLSLWPLPFILLVDYGDSARVDQIVKDEASSFLPREANFRHLEILPIMIRKMLNIVESRTRQNIHLQHSEREYLDLIQAIPDIVYMLDGEGHFTYVNQAVADLGYRPEQLIGKHFSVILDPIDAREVSRNVVLEKFKGVMTGAENAPKLFDERRGSDRMTKNLEVRLRPSVGTVSDDLNARVNAYGEVKCIGYNLPEYDGKDRGTVGIIHDVTERKNHELHLQDTIIAREILLKEIHHRVKNNLQVISSLLSLQGSTVSDDAAQVVFQDCQTQIHSMALVHEQLYQSVDFQGVDMKRYLDVLCRYLLSVYEGAADLVDIVVNAEGVELNVDQATPIALIATELVSNSLKHGFQKTKSGCISVALESVGGEYVLTVSDNGDGGQADGTNESMGTQLVRALASQLSGSFTQDSGQGFSSVIRFPVK